MDAMRNSARIRARSGMATGPSASRGDQSGEPAQVSVPSRRKVAISGGALTAVRPAASRGLGAEFVTPTRVDSDGEHADQLGGPSAAGDAALPRGMEARIDQAIAASPVVQALQALVHEQNRSIREIQELDFAAQRQIQAVQRAKTPSDGNSAQDGTDSPALGAVHEPTSPRLSEEAVKRIESITARAQNTERQLESVCAQIASDVTNSRKSGPRSRSVYGSNSLRFSSALQASSDATQPPISRFARPMKIEDQFRSKEGVEEDFYDKDELEAIRSSEEIKREARSPESIEARFLDRNGYLRNGFVASDNEGSVSFSDDESTDDDSCTTLEEDNGSDEEEEERELRLEIVQGFFTKQRRHYSDMWKLSCAGEALRRLQT